MFGSFCLNQCEQKRQLHFRRRVCPWRRFLHFQLHVSFVIISQFVCLSLLQIQVDPDSGGHVGRAVQELHGGFPGLGQRPRAEDPRQHRGRQRLLRHAAPRGHRRLQPQQVRRLSSSSSPVFVLNCPPSSSLSLSFTQLLFPLAVFFSSSPLICPAHPLSGLL